MPKKRSIRSAASIARDVKMAPRKFRRKLREAGYRKATKLK